MTEIKQSIPELTETAISTASSFLFRAIKAIDDELGDGYAKQHPELIGAFMLSASIEDSASMVAKIIGESLESVADAIQDSSRTK